MHYVGDPCPEDSETRPCNTEACPEDCETTPWTDYTPCSAACGAGTQMRFRDIISRAANGGAACGDLMETQPCEGPPCPEPETPAPSPDTPAPSPFEEKPPPEEPPPPEETPPP